MSETQAGVNFASLFSPAQVIAQSQATKPNEAFMELLVKLAYVHGIGNVDDAYQAVLTREKEMSTVVGPGVAIPHARLDSLESLVVGVLTSKEGIEYPSGERIHLVLLILTPKTSPGLYLQAVSSLAQICKDPATAERVCQLEEPDDVWRYFDRGGMILPDYICAGDVMTAPEVKLDEHETLERAIDLFVRFDNTSLPVTDANNELIGVVSAQELLRVVLPDYILWMDDLSPILNFEPFAEILRRENQTWLAEIMTTDFATVQVDSPAIQVAKEMTRRNVEHAYVLDGKKLVGVVSLRGFIDQVLRS